jgi:Protein of unknown function (DUF742)
MTSPLDDDGSGLRVRPYAITGGRTRAQTDIPIETILVVTPHGEASASRLTFEKGRILSLCQEPQSVAEVSAHLKLALGVARVLVGDMVAEGLVDFNHDQATGERPDRQLLERVFDGLQAL